MTRGGTAACGGLWVTAIALVAGCSLAASVDVCERPVPATRDVNVVTTGDQLALGPRALAGVETGLLAAWATRAREGGGDALYVTRLDATGVRTVTCDVDDREHRLWAEDDEGEPFTIVGGELAAGATQAALVWSSLAASGPSVRVSTIENTRGCPDGPEVATPIALSDEPTDGRAGAPSVTSIGADRYLAVWPSTPSAGRTLAARAFTIAPNGVVRLLSLRDASTGSIVDDRAVVVPGFGGAASGARVRRVDEDRVLVAALALSGAAFELVVGVYGPDLSIRVEPRAMSERFADTARGLGLDLAFDGAQVLAVWAAEDETGRERVWGRFFTPALEPLRSAMSPDGGAFLVATAPDGREITPAVTPRPGGGFFVAFGAAGGAPDALDTASRIDLAAFDPEGARQFLNPACGRDVFDASGRAGRAGGPALALTASGELAMIWTAEGPDNADADESGILGRVFPTASLIPTP